MLNNALCSTLRPTSLNAGATVALTCCSGVACSAVAALPDSVRAPVMVPPVNGRKFVPVLALTQAVPFHCQVVPPDVKICPTVGLGGKVMAPLIVSLYAFVYTWPWRGPLEVGGE